MPGRKSKAHRRKLSRSKTIKAAKRLRTSPGESATSKAYTAGKTYGYSYRIKGPIGEVTTTNIND